MPNYRMMAAQTADLIAYLKKLGTEAAPAEDKDEEEGGDGHDGHEEK